MPHLRDYVVLSSLSQATSIAVCKTMLPAWSAGHEKSQLGVVYLTEALPTHIFMYLSMCSIGAYNIHLFYYSRMATTLLSIL